MASKCIIGIFKRLRFGTLTVSKWTSTERVMKNRGED
jgi:hypothetical protein